MIKEQSRMYNICIWDQRYLKKQINFKQIFMSHFLQPTILLLREGTDTSQGRAQIISNINAACSISEVIRTTLGPRGMDKMITSANMGVTISNDGATILNLLDVVHPAAKVLVDIAKSQDNEVGDGTTSVTLLTGELLKEAKPFVDEGIHPQIIIQGFRQALDIVKPQSFQNIFFQALQKLDSFSINISQQTPEEKRLTLIRCSETALNSKLVKILYVQYSDQLSNYKQFFSELVVQAVEKLDPNLLDKDLIGIKMVTGGSVTDSFLIDGVAFKKTFSYAGFEQQPKKFSNPNICLLNLELELKSEKENAEIRIENPDDYQSIVDAEWQLIYEKLQIIVDAGAQVVLSKLPIGDLATQFFADRNIFCAGRVQNDDLQRVAKATGGVIQTTVNGLNPQSFGVCGVFEEIQVGAERYNIFRGCPQSRTATFVLRGGAEQFISEAERSLNDAIMIVRRCYKASKIVAGGGAIELELSRYLRHHSRQISGKSQHIINAFAKSLEVIPRTIAENAGLNSIEVFLIVMNKLRQRHAQGGEEGKWFGVDVVGSTGICDTYKSFVWEPTLVKRNALCSAVEAACTILSIDETVKNPRSDQEAKMKGGRPPQMSGIPRSQRLGK